MFLLEQMSVSLKSLDNIPLLGENYKIKNVILATDDEVLKANLILVNRDFPNKCAKVEIAAKICEIVTTLSLNEV